MNRIDRATTARITPLVARRVRHVLSRLPGAFDGDEDAIHELRIAARRLRAVLPLLAKRPKGRRVHHAQRRLRKLTRAFGESRDLDVGLPLLQARLQALGASAKREALVKRMRRARARVRRHMVGSVAELDPRALRRELRAIVPRSDASMRAIDRLHEARRERGRELRGLLVEQATRFDPEALHHIRIRARRLRYVAEALDALRDQESQAPALLRKLQDDLGEIHDTHVLAEWLSAQASELEAEDGAAIAAEARALARYFRASGRKQHRAFLATEPSKSLQSALTIMKACERAMTRAEGGAV